MSDDKQQAGHDLEDFDKRLKGFRQSAVPQPQQSEQQGHPAARLMWLAFYVLSELVGGVVCGLAIGWGVDKWLGTRPVFVAIFLIVGCIAAVLNVIRYLKRYEETERQKDEKNR